jgi:ABC-2 type transport system ATP-binding protein
MNLAIEAHNLTKEYRSQKENHPAIQALNLSIRPGELYGLVGPDGAGKSTTIRILATVMLPTSGKAQIGGNDVSHQAEKARPLIGYMPQIFSLYPDLTVIENLNFYANINGVPKERRESRIPELLEFTRLGDFQSRRSEHLSGGMRKKLALACAMIHEPKVMLLDEPTTGVDPVSRRELWRILADIIQNGVTILVSTPYMDEAERCHTVGILYEGRMLATNSPKKLEAEYPFNLIEVKARPRRVIRKVINSIGDIHRWRPVGDRLRLCVDNPEIALSELALNLESAGAEVTILRASKPTIDDVFIHLIEAMRDEP